jgi:hypothetical protein
MNVFYNIGLCVIPLIAIYVIIKVVFTYKRKADKLYIDAQKKMNEYIKERIKEM